MRIFHILVACCSPFQTGAEFVAAKVKEKQESAKQTVYQTNLSLLQTKKNFFKEQICSYPSTVGMHQK